MKSAHAVAFVDLPTENQLVALARKFFTARARMVGLQVPS